jgi:hypothetical protein
MTNSPPIKDDIQENQRRRLSTSSCTKKNHFHDCGTVYVDLLNARTVHLFFPFFSSCKLMLYYSDHRPKIIGCEKCDIDEVLQSQSQAVFDGMSAIAPSLLLKMLNGPLGSQTLTGPLTDSFLST